MVQLSMLGATSPVFTSGAKHTSWNRIVRLLYSASRLTSWVCKSNTWLQNKYNIFCNYLEIRVIRTCIIANLTTLDEGEVLGCWNLLYFGRADGTMDVTIPRCSRTRTIPNNELSFSHMIQTMAKIPKMADPLWAPFNSQCSHYSDGIKFQACSRFFPGRNYNFPG